MLHHFYLRTEGPGVCSIRTAAGLHVGNFKQIGGVWKFKAIGYNVTGQIVPGGGPLTDKHNAMLVELDQSGVDRVLNL